MAHYPETEGLTLKEINRFIEVGARDDDKLMQMLAERYGSVFMRCVMSRAKDEEVSFEEASARFIRECFLAHSQTFFLAHGMELEGQGEIDA